MDTHHIAVNTIKGLSMDAVQAANSGHPGMPMGCADMASVLWGSFLKHDPKSPNWPDRDRFILSAGHGSMLLYSLLHLSGYDLPLSEIKNFRQWDSKTPGHPEYGHTAGVETTTGPLGQGFATGVGFALAERVLRERFGEELVSHFTYGIVSDGDLMEGITNEAASIAGHLGLGKMIYLYDDNHISIEGDTDLAFTEDRMGRLAALGWHVQSVDGHDKDALHAALAAAKAETSRPSIIAARTTIGQGSDKEGSEKTHGAPLGAEDIANTKTRLGMDPAVSFATPAEAYAHFAGAASDGAAAHAAWKERVANSPKGAELLSWLKGDREALLDGVQWPSFEVGTKLATRKASAACLKALVAAAPNVFGGSADLAGSNGTNIGAPSITPSHFELPGTLHFGVREHAMAALCNGMALHGGILPYCATFLVFHDYMRPSVRLSALMGLQVLYIYTHDSIFLGEDGPTHQPVETLMALRGVPNLRTFRPCDAAETKASWEAAVRRTEGPTCLVLTRQGLPVLDREVLSSESGLTRGAYILSDVSSPELVLIATGSEVPLALDAQKDLSAKGIQARVVSAPSLELFKAQSADYRNEVLPQEVPVVSIEAGVTWGWEAFTGLDGAQIGIDRFGASAPAAVLAEAFGFTSANVVATALTVLGKNS